jgi:hypothetical protein
MDKRYQVFVSSTYTDLKDERRIVIETLMKVDCIPAGMELFPASDEEQFNFIKRVIDDCDYYLLVIGGRYGQIDADGVSYTEREYDYALQRGLRVIVLLHGAPGEIASKYTEKDLEGQRKLAAFRDKVGKGRLVSFWTSSGELEGKVAVSMLNAIKTFPAVGWVRADKISNEQALAEINELRKEKEKLEAAAKTDQALADIPDLADLDEEFTVRGEYYQGAREYSDAVAFTWRHIFVAIAPYLEQSPRADSVQSYLADALFDQHGSNPRINDQDFQTIQVQLQALGLIRCELAKAQNGAMYLYWVATPEGRKMGFQLRAIRTKKTGAGKTPASG